MSYEDFGDPLSYRNFGNLFGSSTDLRHGDTCGCEICNFEHRQGQALDGIRKNKHVDLLLDEIFGRRTVVSEDAEELRFGT